MPQAAKAALEKAKGTIRVLNAENTKLRECQLEGGSTAELSQLRHEKDGQLKKNRELLEEVDSMGRENLNRELELERLEVEMQNMRQNEMERWKVAAIVDVIDTNGDGHLDTQEVKVLVGQMTGIPVVAIADDHPEVVALAEKSREELIQQLCRIVHPARISDYYETLCLGKGKGKAPE